MNVCLHIFIIYLYVCVCVKAWACVIYIAPYWLNRICPRKTIKPTENKTTQPQNGAGAKAANIKQLPMELMGNESITAEISSMQKMTIKIKLDKKKNSRPRSKRLAKHIKTPKSTRCSASSSLERLLAERSLYESCQETSYQDRNIHLE